jgi:hypothetical protein
MKPLSVQHSVGDACTPQKAMARKDGANCACARAAPNGGGRHSAQPTLFRGALAVADGDQQQPITHCEQLAGSPRARRTHWIRH